MIKKLNDLLSGWPMTAVGGVFLLASFILPRIGFPAGGYLAWICVAICGIPLLYLAIHRIIFNKGVSKISSALLISLAMIAAILIGDLFAAGEVTFIMELGALLEDMTTARAKRGLKKLIELSPATGRVIRDGMEVIVPADEIQKGDMLRILPGETIPADGVIVSGETSVDQSVMTGESLPVDKAAGDEVFSGTINRFGSVDIEATRVGGDSSLQRLIRMVEEAGEKQAPTQRIADRWASWLVPVALLIAVAAFIFTGDIVRAVTVMVVFCPCALILATPTAIMAAIGQATKHGVIVRSGEALEKMGSVCTVAFDKTGTLTRGRLEVSDVVPTADIDRTELLRLAASAESRSEHPLARAILEKARNDGIPLYDTSGFKMSAGKGIYAELYGDPYFLGSEKYLFENGIDASAAATALEVLSADGKATVIVSDGSRILGVVALSDTLRSEAPEVVGQLERMGMKTVLLTGDNRRAAEYFAGRAGISDVRAGLLPEDKVRCVADLKQNGGVCMTGDSVNDAPALKTADVGVAMGAMGSDIAVEAADIALTSDDLSALPYLKWLSNATVRTIRLAITLSMCINLAAVTLSVLGVLTPTTGAIVHNAGSCFVVLLAALLYDRKFRQPE